MEIKKAKSEIEYKECFEFIKNMWKQEFKIDFDLNIEKQYEGFLKSNIYYIKKDGKILAIIQLARVEKGFKLKDGFVPKDDCYFLWRIGVLKEYRNKGYGTKLINFSIDTIKKTDIRKMYIMSEINNIEYYSRFGFERIIGYTEKNIGNTKGVFMELNL